MQYVDLSGLTCLAVLNVSLSRISVQHFLSNVVFGTKYLTVPTSYVLAIQFKIGIFVIYKMLSLLDRASS